MKIGIVTFWTSNDNYGQQLQLYALQKYLRLAGHDAFLIHYDSDQQKRKPFMHRLWHKINPVFIYKNYKKQKVLNEQNIHPRYFAEFRAKYIHFSDIHYASFAELQKNPPEADCYIVGSDQVWNFGEKAPDLNKNYHRIHSRMLDFGSNNVLRISYAPSWSVRSLHPKMIEEIKPLLAKFDYISVREKSGIELCKQCGRNDAEWVPDPTLLLDENIYRTLYQKENIKFPAKPYLFLYMLSNKYTFSLENAYKWAEEHHMDVVYVAGNGTLSEREQSYLTVPEWLAYVDHASVVLTNSFHCAVFSTLFQKPFGVVPREGSQAGMNKRIESLFELCGLDERYVRNADDFEWLAKPVHPMLNFDRTHFLHILSTLERERKSPSSDIKNGEEYKRLNVKIPRIPSMIKANRYNCSGCSACANVCPVHAITMKEDVEGFCYPEIDTGKCIQCGRCNLTCPSLSHLENRREEVQDTKDYPTAWAYQCLDDKVRLGSSSGGFFTVLATQVLSEGGSVFGAAWDENWEVHHMEVRSLDELGRLRVSKYVQSRMGDAYRQAVSRLREGKRVLFTGTPCQIEGMWSAAKGMNRNQLILAQCVCHGVPSPAVWRNYLEKCRKKRLVIGVSMRCKYVPGDSSVNWNKYDIHIAYSDHSNYMCSKRKDRFMKSFLKDIMLRPSCYHCSCKDNYSHADITMGDFWGIDKVLQGWNDGKGTSLILIHSEKGQKVFDSIAERKLQVRLDDALRYNPSIRKSATESRKRAPFMRDFQKNPGQVNRWLEKYTMHTIGQKVVYGVRFGIRQLLFRE